MRKDVLRKGILVLIVLAVLTLGFTGCGTTIITTTPTYYVSYIYISILGTEYMVIYILMAHMLVIYGHGNG